MRETREYADSDTISPQIEADSRSNLSVLEERIKGEPRKGYGKERSKDLPPRRPISFTVSPY